jgi:four helix bundle protein
MDAVTGNDRLRAFRATDAFAVEAYRVSRSLQDPGPGSLAEAIRQSAVRSGGKLAAASARQAGGRAERRLLVGARGELMEGRYYLYLARRFGLLDAKGYRALTVRQDAALREIDAVLSVGASSRARAPTP